MKIEIEIPADLTGFIWSLDVQELDDDEIVNNIGQSDHFEKLIDTGLVTEVWDWEGEPRHRLTRLGKLVYESKKHSIPVFPVFEGFSVSFMKSAAMQDGKAVMMLSSKDYKGLQSKYKSVGAK